MFLFCRAAVPCTFLIYIFNYYFLIRQTCCNQTTHPGDHLVTVYFVLCRELEGTDGEV